MVLADPLVWWAALLARMFIILMFMLLWFCPTKRRKWRSKLVMISWMNTGCWSWDCAVSSPPGLSPPRSLCRRSTRWWALWSWWKWTRTAWRPSRGWTRSSPRWIRTTTTRSRWRSSKRRPRATHPSYYCCSVTSRNRQGGEQSAPPAATDCTERSFMFHSVCSYFHWKQTKKLQ